MLKYKHKYLVPGDTVRYCGDFRGKRCLEYTQEQGLKYRPCMDGKSWIRNESKCPFPINKPSEYIVAEDVNGNWSCSCPAWKFRRECCNHILKAQAHPTKYEIDPEWTGKTVETIKKVTD